MTIVNIAWATLGAILQIVVIGFAYVVGRHHGYWKRVNDLELRIYRIELKQLTTGEVSK